MSFSRKLIVIDCGASRTALGIFSHHRGRLRLDRHVVENFSAPLGPGPEWLERTRAAFPKLREQAERGGPCVLVLPGHVVLTKFLRIPHVKPDQRQRVVRFESEQHLPIALSELVWDSVVAGEHEAGLEVMLAASHLRKVEPLCAAARAAGFDPRVVLPASLATLAAFRGVHGQQTQPSLMISIGARSATFLLMENGRFVLRTFSHCPETSDSAADAAGLAQRLAQELMRSMLYYRRQDKLADPERIYLTGGGARLAGLREALAERLKLPVEELELSRALAIAPGVVSEGTLPVLTELAGAALTQRRDDHAVVNLLPPMRRRQAERRRRQIMVAAALLLIALPLSVIWSKGSGPKAHRPVASGQVERNAVHLAAVQPSPVEVSESDPDPVPEEESDKPAFGVELLSVKREPYRLQLAGYLGGPEDYLAVFTSPGQPGTMVARSGGRLEPQEVELKKFEVRKVAVTHEDSWPIYEVAAEATLHDERADDDIVLNSRTWKFMRPQAMLRLAGDGRAAQVVREGDTVEDGDTVYRIERIRTYPPEIVLTRDAPELGEAEVHVLHVAADDRAGEAAGSVRPIAGMASSAR